MLYIWYNSRKLSRIKPYFVLLRVVYPALNKDYLLNGNFGHDYNAFCGFYLEIIVANSFFDAARYVVRGSMTQPARGSGDEVYAGIN